MFMQFSKFHSLSLATSVACSNRVCYLLMPDLERNGLLEYIDKTGKEHDCSMAVVSVPDWNDDLTPWPAPGVFKGARPFQGEAGIFLNEFLECMDFVEESMGLTCPERYLIGVSLSGLFGIWTLLKTDAFSGIGSISGSLWYDGFVEWLGEADVKNPSVKVFMCLGDREHLSRDKRISQVETLTENAADILRSRNIEVTYQLVEGTHFSPVEPRIELALQTLL